jgi:dienelactone hydrolase
VDQHEVLDGDLRGVLMLPDDHKSAPAVVVLGGSSGGVPATLAAAAAERGLVALGVGYFGAEGLQPNLVQVPVEIVEAALRWLSRGPRSGNGPVALLGVSKGAELALLAASLMPSLVGSVVAVAPSSVVFAGIVSGRASSESSWTWRRHDVPFVPYDPSVGPQFTQHGMRTRPMYEAALANRTSAETGVIEVERITAPVLLLSGSDDQVWPSSSMGLAIRARAVAYGVGDNVEHVVYEGAGHLLLTARPAVGNSGFSFDFGGTAEGAAAASADVWSRLTEFIKGANAQ